MGHPECVELMKEGLLASVLFGNAGSPAELHKMLATRKAYLRPDTSFSSSMELKSIKGVIFAPIAKVKEPLVRAYIESVCPVILGPF